MNYAAAIWYTECWFNTWIFEINYMRWLSGMPTSQDTTAITSTIKHTSKREKEIKKEWN